MICLTHSDWTNTKKMDLFLTTRNSLSVSAGTFSKKKIEQGFPCILLFFHFFLLNKGYGAMWWWKSLIPGDDWPVSPLSSCSPGSPDYPLSVVAAGLACSLLTARHEREQLRVFSGPRYRVTSDRPPPNLYNNREYITRQTVLTWENMLSKSKPNAEHL